MTITGKNKKNCLKKQKSVNNHFFFFPGEKKKTCWKSDFDGTQTKTTYTLVLESDCSGRLYDVVETTRPDGSGLGVGHGPELCDGNCRLPSSCNYIIAG